MLVCGENYYEFNKHKKNFNFIPLTCTCTCISKLDVVTDVHMDFLFVFFIRMQESAFLENLRFLDFFLSSPSAPLKLCLN